MTMQGIKLDVVTPEESIFSDHVSMVVAPGTEGVIGILPNHAPVLTGLREGELIVRQKDKEDVAFAIGGGFMDVQPNQVTILADVAERASAINMERAKAARERAKSLISSGNLKHDDLLKAEAALRRALIRMKVAEKHRSIN